MASCLQWLAQAFDQIDVMNMIVFTILIGADYILSAFPAINDGMIISRYSCGYFFERPSKYDIDSQI